MEEWQRSTELSGDRSPKLAARSRLSAELARVAATSAEPLAVAVGCDLYRQAVYWALCALAPVSAVSSVHSDSVWARLDDELLLPLGATVEARQLLRARLAAGDFVAFAELPSAELDNCCAAFHDLNEALLARFETTQRGLLAIRDQRAWRLSALFGCLVALSACLLMIRAHMAGGGDLAFGAEWRTSSSYAGAGGCASPDQECASKTGWFFHTGDGDPDPWIEFNLDGSKAVSTVAIENRDDCCAERSVPLAIEVSDDQKHWHSVAERREQFATWRANFPVVHAKWVRLHLLTARQFHLKNVRIFP